MYRSRDTTMIELITVKPPLSKGHPLNKGHMFKKPVMIYWNKSPLNKVHL